MKIFKICLLLLVSSSNALAVTPEEFKTVASQFKMIDTSREYKPSINFRTKDGSVLISFEKQILDDGDIFFNNSINVNDINVYSDDRFGFGIGDYDLSVTTVLCFSKKNDMYSVSQTSYSDQIQKGGQIGGVNGAITMNKTQDIIFYQPMYYKIN